MAADHRLLGVALAAVGQAQALGARDAMNLDGGGSVAMWFGGGYVAGPGRQLPNAILLMKP